MDTVYAAFDIALSMPYKRFKIVGVESRHSLPSDSCPMMTIKMPHNGKILGTTLHET